MDIIDDDIFDPIDTVMDADVATEPAADLLS